MLSACALEVDYSAIPHEKAERHFNDIRTGYNNRFILTHLRHIVDSFLTSNLTTLHPSFPLCPFPQYIVPVTPPLTSIHCAVIHLLLSCTSNNTASATFSGGFPKPVAVWYDLPWGIGRPNRSRVG